MSTPATDGKALEAKGDVEVVLHAVEPITAHEIDPLEIDQSYLSASTTTKIFRGVLFQMILFGSISFAGPSVQDAISNLGGGGLSTPFLGNLANALNYASSCIITITAGPLINLIGLKPCMIIAAITMPFYCVGFYVNARFAIDWIVLFFNVITGLGGGLLYVSEATAMLTYPLPDDRGLYLGIWSAMRNLGSVVGGAINYAINFSYGGSGGVAWSTYIVFIALCCTTPIFAILLSPTRKVRRRDGTRVNIGAKMNFKHEMIGLWRHIRHPRTMLMFMPAFFSFFLGGCLGTYLSLNFSVRSRALSSLIFPIIAISVTVPFGRFILDNTRWRPRTRAWVACAFWGIPYLIAFIWLGVNYAKINSQGRVILDFQDDANAWIKGYMPYLLFFVFCYPLQLTLFWILGTFSTDVKAASRTSGLFRCFETLGQAVSYGINSKKDLNQNIPFIIFGVVTIISVPCLYFLIRMIPDEPAMVDDVGETEGVEGDRAVKAAV